MKTVQSFANIFKRYDLDLEVTGKAKTVSKDPILQEIAQFVVEGDEEGIAPAVQKALGKKSPLDVINDALIAGMNEVSRLWEEGIYFLPQVILASDAMNVGIALCEKSMGKAMNRKGKVVTHTAEGDIHDIGQVIVNALLNANGFEVINLGADVPVDKVVAACKEHKPVMVTGTALMTTTMTAFPKIAHQLATAGLTIPLVCGGGAVSEEYVTSFDLGIWGKEASQAPGMAEDALAGENWESMRGKWNG
ncbi:MAG: cobalamin B12-binding domain-containing protein [Deltaproteobacteria bacterium]|nr:cobalamin B12-binding domain-containing protein [Deltaproteobacteria bacterium]